MNTTMFAAVMPTPQLRVWTRPVLACYWMLLVVGSHWPRLDLGDPLHPQLLQTDKVLHFAAFGVLAWLAVLAKLGGRGASEAKHVSVGVLLAAGYAVLDEMTQPWFARVVDSADLIADGLAIGMVFLVLAPRPALDLATLRRVRWSRLLCVAVLLPVGALALSGEVWEAARSLKHAMRLPGHDYDKALHLVMGVGGTLLLGAMAIAGAARPRWCSAVAIAVAILVSPLLEFVQVWVGRNQEVLDLYLHMLGVLIGMVVWSAAVAWRFRRLG